MIGFVSSVFALGILVDLEPNMLKYGLPAARAREAETEGTADCADVPVVVADGSNDCGSLHGSNIDPDLVDLVGVEPNIERNGFTAGLGRDIDNSANDGHNSSIGG